jgi:hypothetical protein
MNVGDRFRRFFVVDNDTVAPTPEPSEELAVCHEALEFARTTYYTKFMAYLESVIDAPFPISDQVTMIASAARVNAFKEVKRHLKGQVERANSVIQTAREERDV